MAADLSVTVKTIQERRSLTPGYRPPTQAEGEPFVNLKDGIRRYAVGDGTYLETDIRPIAQQIASGPLRDALQSASSGGPVSVPPQTLKANLSNASALPSDVSFPALKASLGLVKGDVALGSVDNTSDATKAAAGNPIGDLIRALVDVVALGPKINFREKTYSILDYGGSEGLSGAANRSALAAAHADLRNSASGAGVLWLPPGLFSVAGAPIDITNCRTRVIGEGRGISRIAKADNGGVFYANHTGDQLVCTSHLEGFSLYADTLNTGTPVDITFSAATAGDTMNGSVIQELDIRASNPSATNVGWSGTAGIRVVNSVGGLIARNAIRGVNGTTNTLSRGISYEGITTDHNSRENRVYFADVAFLHSGNAETCNHQFDVCLLCNYGIFEDNWKENPSYRVAGGSIDNCHFNTIYFGVRLINHQHIRVTNNLFYRWLQSGTTWVGLQAENCNDQYAAGNVFIGCRFQ